MSIEIKKLSNREIDKFSELIQVLEDVFEMKNFKMSGKNHLQQLLENESFFVFGALSDSKVVGGLTSYTLQQYYSKFPLVYISDLAVRTEIQRSELPAC